MHFYSSSFHEKSEFDKVIIFIECKNLKQALDKIVFDNNAAAWYMPNLKL